MLGIEHDSQSLSVIVRSNDQTRLRKPFRCELMPTNFRGRELAQPDPSIDGGKRLDPGSDIPYLGILG